LRNLEIAKILNNIADILELQEVQFKPRAYRNAARGVEGLTENIADVYKRGELENIPGVGKHIAEKIAEYLEKGKSKYYNQLKKKVKIDIESLHQIPTLGPKKIKFLYEKLKIKNIKDLEKAIKKGKLKKLKGFGEETEKNLSEGIKLVKSRPKRFLYYQALPIVNEIKDYFNKFNFVKRIEVAGSFRRGKETIGDLDFLVISSKPNEIIKLFTQLPDVKKVISKGTTRSSVRLSNGLQVDLRVVKEKELGSALMYFIGNKQHNIELRKIALSKGYTLSEYGLFKLNGKKWVAGRTEEDIYKRLGMDYIPPELRENNGEIKAAQEKRSPQLVTNKNINGVFHNHTKWSDGSNSLLEMAQKAEQMGMKFISFNDHFGDIAITNPLNEKRLVGYLKEIERVRKKVKIKVFSGVEIDILKDGKLPLSKEKLKKIDVVIAAIHLATRMPEEQMTKRVCDALENYPIKILAHPTDRLLNSREAIKINLEKVFAVAKKNNVYLEINSSPERLDLNGENIRAAKKRGCKFVISTDGHDLQHLENYYLGIIQARRGGLEKKDILNCYSSRKINKILIKIN
jgi:DNA polymerase (family X)